MKNRSFKRVDMNVGIIDDYDELPVGPKKHHYHVKKLKNKLHKLSNIKIEPPITQKHVIILN